MNWRPSTQQILVAVLTPPQMPVAAPRRIDGPARPLKGHSPTTTRHGGRHWHSDDGKRGVRGAKGDAGGRFHWHDANQIPTASSSTIGAWVAAPTPFAPAA